MKKTRQRGEDANITTACPPKQDADLDHAFLDGRAEGLVIFPDVHQSLKGSQTAPDQSIPGRGLYSDTVSTYQLNSLVLGQLESMLRQDYFQHLRNFAFLDRDFNGYLSGIEARPILLSSGLHTDELRRIWDLADLTCDGNLNCHEYAVAMLLIETRCRNHPLPDTLPQCIKDGWGTASTHGFMQAYQPGRSFCPPSPRELLQQDGCENGSSFGLWGRKETMSQSQTMSLVSSPCLLPSPRQLLQEHGCKVESEEIFPPEWAATMENQKTMTDASIADVSNAIPSVVMTTEWENFSSDADFFELPEAACSSKHVHSPIPLSHADPIPKASTVQILPTSLAGGSVPVRFHPRNVPDLPDAHLLASAQHRSAEAAAPIANHSWPTRSPPINSSSIPSSAKVAEDIAFNFAFGQEASTSSDSAAPCPFFPLVRISPLVRTPSVAPLAMLSPPALPPTPRPISSEPIKMQLIATPTTTEALPQSESQARKFADLSSPQVGSLSIKQSPPGPMSHSPPQRVPPPPPPRKTPPLPSPGSMMQSPFRARLHRHDTADSEPSVTQSWTKACASTAVKCLTETTDSSPTKPLADFWTTICNGDVHNNCTIGHDEEHQQQHSLGVICSCLDKRDRTKTLSNHVGKRDFTAEPSEEIFQNSTHLQQQKCNEFSPDNLIGLRAAVQKVIELEDFWYRSEGESLQRPSSVNSADNSATSPSSLSSQRSQVFSRAQISASNNYQAATPVPRLWFPGETPRNHIEEKGKTSTLGSNTLFSDCVNVAQSQAPYKVETMTEVTADRQTEEKEIEVLQRQILRLELEKEKMEEEETMRHKKMEERRRAEDEEAARSKQMKEQEDTRREEEPAREQGEGKRRQASAECRKEEFKQDKLEEKQQAKVELGRMPVNDAEKVVILPYAMEPAGYVLSDVSSLSPPLLQSATPMGKVQEAKKLSHPSEQRIEVSILNDASVLEKSHQEKKMEEGGDRNVIEGIERSKRVGACTSGESLSHRQNLSTAVFALSLVPAEELVREQIEIGFRKALGMELDAVEVNIVHCCKMDLEVRVSQKIGEFSALSGVLKTLEFPCVVKEVGPIGVCSLPGRSKGISRSQSTESFFSPRREPKSGEWIQQRVMELVKQKAKAEMVQLEQELLGVIRAMEEASLNDNMALVLAQGVLTPEELAIIQKDALLEELNFDANLQPQELHCPPHRRKLGSFQSSDSQQHTPDTASLSSTLPTQLQLEAHSKHDSSPLGGSKYEGSQNMSFTGRLEEPDIKTDLENQGPGCEDHARTVFSTEWASFADDSARGEGQYSPISSFSPAPVVPSDGARAASEAPYRLSKCSSYASAVSSLDAWTSLNALWEERGEDGQSSGSVGEVMESGGMGENRANKMEEENLQRPLEMEKEEFEKTQGPRVPCSSCSPLSVNEAQCTPSVSASTSDSANIGKSGVMARGVHRNLEDFADAELLVAKADKTEEIVCRALFSDAGQEQKFSVESLMKMSSCLACHIGNLNAVKSIGSEAIRTRLLVLRKAAIFQAALEDYSFARMCVEEGGVAMEELEVTAAEKAALGFILEEEEGAFNAAQARAMMAQVIWPKTLVIAFEEAKCQYFDSTM